jgi:cobalt-zinc-cadmium efflux system protein
MSRDHHEHRHDHPHQPGIDNERRVFWTMLLTGVFMLVEVAGGLLSGSLALLADAGHMLTDFAALVLAWFGFRVSRRPADQQRTYGYFRFEVLVAFVNGITLVAIVAWIFYEAIRRFFAPTEILGGTMLAVALLGLMVNIIAFMLLHGGDRSNLNVRGAAAHVLGDLLGSIAAIVAAGVILTTGWTPIDPLLSMLVGLLVLRSAWGIIADSSHILLEGAPRHMDIDQLTHQLQDTVTEVRDVHHVHVWSLTPQQPLVTLHVTMDGTGNQDAVLKKVKAFLEHTWRVKHSTVQVERASCPDHAAPKERSCLSPPAEKTGK